MTLEVLMHPTEKPRIFYSGAYKVSTEKVFFGITVRASNINVRNRRQYFTKSRVLAVYAVKRSSS
jgi:hypothetical protein